MLIDGLLPGQTFDPEEIVFVIPETLDDQWCVHVNFGPHVYIYVRFDSESEAIGAAELLKVRVNTALTSLALDRRWKTI